LKEFLLAPMDLNFQSKVIIFLDICYPKSSPLRFMVKPQTFLALPDKNLKDKRRE